VPTRAGLFSCEACQLVVFANDYCVDFRSRVTLHRIQQIAALPWTHCRQPNRKVKVPRLSTSKVRLLSHYGFRLVNTAPLLNALVLAVTLVSERRAKIHNGYQDSGTALDADRTDKKRIPVNRLHPLELPSTACLIPPSRTLPKISHY